MRVVAYARVSTDEQKVSGLGVEAQLHEIGLECKRRGWRLLYQAVDDGVSGKYGVKRPALDQARELCKSGEADVIMALKLDRFARSSRLLAELIDEAAAAPYRLVFLDMGGIDTGTAAGKMFCQMLGVFAEFERDLICERTKLALKAKKVRNEPLGRPKEIGAEVEERILKMRGEQYLSHRRIADALNAEGVPAPRGGRWGRSSIAAVLRRAVGEAGDEDVELDAVA